MKAERSRGMMGQVTITVKSAEAPGASRLYRAGRLGLAFRAPAVGPLEALGDSFIASGPQAEDLRTCWSCHKP